MHTEPSTQHVHEVLNAEKNKEKMTSKKVKLFSVAIGHPSSWVTSKKLKHAGRPGWPTAFACQCPNILCPSPPKNLLWASMLTGYLFPIMYHSLLEYNTLDLCLYKYDLL